MTMTPDDAIWAKISALTLLPLTFYVIRIGNRIASLITSNESTGQRLHEHQSQLNDHNRRISRLEQSRPRGDDRHG